MFSYVDEGQGEVLVFVHSYLWDKEMWRPQIDFFKDRYRCISIDLFGHGNSPLLDIETDLETIAKDIVLFLENLEITMYTYIGLSVGGMLAPYMYKHDKDRIRKIIMMDTYVGVEPHATQELYFNLLDTIEKTHKIPEPLIEKIAPMFFSPQVDRNSKLYLDFANHLRTLKPENIPTIVKMGYAIFGRYGVLEYLSHIQVPLIFITGECDIPRPFKEAQEMAKLNAHSELYSVKNAGHISNLENSDEVNRILDSII
ncbi:alpha/beta hydrolase [uncultured Fusobacterium sp.]|uniref:alpha/beta fold hydrolase n=1 Tax=uncultured Fusobacterium sp. TaxID=159267 RepID=UPI002593FADF|nr:alpha/beta hydrolase [uncultured Fusobacterium sp.]